MQYSITYAGVNTVIDDLSSATNQIYQVLEELITQVNTNLDPEHWTGQAKDQWAATQTKWNNLSSAAAAALAQARTTLDQIAQNYQTTDRAAAGAWPV